jgi:hypothetical protein
MFISMCGEAEDIPIADYEMLEFENQKDSSLADYF